MRRVDPLQVGNRALGLAIPIALVVASFATGAASTDLALVPPSLQVDLLDRVAYFEHGFRERTGGRATVLVVHASSMYSRRVATQLASALRESESIGGVPTDARLVAYESPSALRAEVESARASIVWFAPELEASIATVVQSLTGSRTLTVASTAVGVRAGAIVGFDLEASRPVILINETRANRDGIRFSFEVLSRARLIR